MEDGARSETELAKHITPYGEPRPGLEQYTRKKLVVAFEAITWTWSENSRVKAQDIISKVCVVNQEGNKTAGLDPKVEVLL